jgi:hypothetical protein
MGEGAKDFVMFKSAMAKESAGHQKKMRGLFP